MKKKIYFLILNYRTKEETKQCVQTIKMLDNVEYDKEILIIDNCSNDGSFEQLEQIFRSDSSVKLYQTEFNMGFSKANNYGYQLIRKRNDAVFIIVCNSDIEFRQTDFLKKLLKEYARNQFDLCGPDVYCESDLNKGWKGHQSPAYPWEHKCWFVKSQIRFNSSKLAYLKETDKICTKTKYFLARVYMKVQNMLLNIMMRTIYKNYKLVRHQSIPLHGSCLIVTSRFIQEEEKIFTPETKFYGEELLLFLKQRRKKYCSVYLPTLQVWHMQGRATSKLGENIQKKIFICENLKRSAEIYLQEIKGVEYLLKDKVW